jgi:hypothetical protein
VRIALVAMNASMKLLPKPWAGTPEKLSPITHGRIPEDYRRLCTGSCLQQAQWRANKYETGALPCQKKDDALEAVVRVLMAFHDYYRLLYIDVS